MITLEDLLRNQVLGPVLRDHFAAGEKRAMSKGFRKATKRACGNKATGTCC